MFTSEKSYITSLMWAHLPLIILCDRLYNTGATPWQVQQWAMKLTHFLSQTDVHNITWWWHPNTTSVDRQDSEVISWKLWNTIHCIVGVVTGWFDGCLLHKVLTCTVFNLIVYHSIWMEWRDPVQINTRWRIPHNSEMTRSSGSWRKCTIIIWLVH